MRRFYAADRSRSKGATRMPAGTRRNPLARKAGRARREPRRSSRFTRDPPGLRAACAPEGKPLTPDERDGGLAVPRRREEEAVGDGEGLSEERAIDFDVAKADPPRRPPLQALPSLASRNIAAPSAGVP